LGPYTNTYRGDGSGWGVRRLLAAPKPALLSPLCGSWEPKVTA